MSRYIEYICTTRGVPMCTLASREPRAASCEPRGDWRMACALQRSVSATSVFSLEEVWASYNSGNVNHIRFANNGGSFASTEFSFSATTARSGLISDRLFQYDFKYFQNLQHSQFQGTSSFTSCFNTFSNKQNQYQTQCNLY